MLFGRTNFEDGMIPISNSLVEIIKVFIKEIENVSQFKLSRYHT